MSRRANSDEDIRSIERRALSGDREALGTFIKALDRAGRLTIDRVNAARRACGLSQIPDGLSQRCLRGELGLGASYLVEVSWDDLVMSLDERAREQLIYFDGSSVISPDWFSDQANDDADFWINAYEEENDVKLTEDQQIAVTDQFLYALERAWMPQRVLTDSYIRSWIVTPINNCVPEELSAEQVEQGLCVGKAIEIEAVDRRTVGVNLDEVGVRFRIFEPLVALVATMSDVEGDPEETLQKYTGNQVLDLAREARHRDGVETRISGRDSNDYEWPSKQVLYKAIADSAPKKPKAKATKGRKKPKRKNPLADSDDLAQRLYDAGFGATEIPLSEVNLSTSDRGHPVVDEPERYRWFLIREFPVRFFGLTLDDLVRDAGIYASQEKWRHDKIVDLLRGAPAWPSIATATGILVDGFHRVVANRTLRRKTMPVVVAVDRSGEDHWDDMWIHAHDGEDEMRRNSAGALKRKNPRVYHRSPNDSLQEFDPKKMKFGDYGPGYYFSQDHEGLRHYGAYLYEADLDLKHPLDVENASQAEIDKLSTTLRLDGAILPGEPTPPLVQMFNMAQSMWSSGMGYDPHIVIKVLKRLGYDGIVVPSKGYWVTFDPAQVKLKSLGRTNPGARKKVTKKMRKNPGDDELRLIERSWLASQDPELFRQLVGAAARLGVAWHPGDEHDPEGWYAEPPDHSLPTDAMPAATIQDALNDRPYLVEDPPGRWLILRPSGPETLHRARSWVAHYLAWCRAHGYTPESLPDLGNDRMNPRDEERMKRPQGVAHQNPGDESIRDLEMKVKSMARQLAAAANEAIAEFDWESGGGACDEVASAMATVLSEAGIDTEEGGHEGDDHAYLIAIDDDGREACGVDVPADVYEIGGGYNWRRREGAVVRPEDVTVWRIMYKDVRENGRNGKRTNMDDDLRSIERRVASEPTADHVSQYVTTLVRNGVRGEQALDAVFALASRSLGAPDALVLVNGIASKIRIEAKQVWCGRSLLVDGKVLATRAEDYKLFWAPDAREAFEVVPVERLFQLNEGEGASIAVFRVVGSPAFSEHRVPSRWFEYLEASLPEANQAQAAFAALRSEIKPEEWSDWMALRLGDAVKLAVNGASLKGAKAPQRPQTEILNDNDVLLVGHDADDAVVELLLENEVAGGLAEGATPFDALDATSVDPLWRTVLSPTPAKVTPWRCSCGSRVTWTPTFCNFSHCAECFDPVSADHDECGWAGQEHESFGPASDLPGNVWIAGDDSKERPED